MNENVKIGLEIHVQLNKLKSKMFCGCSTDYHDAPPNTHVCPVCLGLPGSLPTINKKAVEYALKVALALNCEVETRTHFYRKNYFYPDLPKNFQISQYDFPIGSNGYVEIEGDNGAKVVRIKRVHMEEDPGRLVHIGTIDRSRYTLVDYNRSGMALLEIVTEPDMGSPKEARSFLAKLRSILEYLDVFDGDKEGAMRIDANISIEGNERAEVKNISSHKGVEKALQYEIIRQRNILRRGGRIVRETRHFDEERNITISMRLKEEEEDYRYFPEPDLPPFSVVDWVPVIRETIPELPDEKRDRFISQYGISEALAKALTSDHKIADLFEDVASEFEPKLVAGWVADVLKGELNYRGLSLDVFPPSYMKEILKMLVSDEITDRGAVIVIRKVLDEGLTPQEVIEREGLRKAGESELETVVRDVLKNNTKAVEDYRAGKKEALNFLVGQVIRNTKGRADPKLARKMIEEMIENLA
jgi:aspartyl-tRNA(Asn)/glutamyl-tRNA(Gln) amidotransferase subunit B